MRCPLLLSCLLLGLTINAQADYFQQEVDYSIQVRLDDESHQLHGNWEMVYTNHSPNTLGELYLHLWPNAYSSRSTALADQFLRQGNTDFYFAADEDLGYIDSLRFQTQPSQELASFEFVDGNPDIILLQLPYPLEPDRSVTLQTPFRVQLPKSFSRLGHAGQSYQITQWYPKPAVYDRDGWHPMPYLDNGEYYSEFGSFDVSITLPDNYWVAATGELMTREEEERLREKATQDQSRSFEASYEIDWKTPAFPPSSQEQKTIRYRAEQVHDFAWFADKRYYVQSDTLALPSGRTINTWAFFTDQQAHLWQKATDYLKRSTRYYSQRIGEYPYPQVTAVQSIDSKGGGMEYPMITLIGWENNAQALDDVITHEVGHNWFYGILASNERDHPWMDEGFNSFYEQEYMAQYYSPNSFVPERLRGKSSINDSELTYRYAAQRHRDQAPNTNSDSLYGNNYWLGAYDKPALALHQMQAWLGRDIFDAAMQTYFREWQFRHPQPEDLQASLEKSTGRSMDWFFDDFMNSTAQQDYRIEGIHEEGRSTYVYLDNKGRAAGPAPIVATDRSGQEEIRWVQVPGDKIVAISFPKKEYTRISIDPDHQTLEVNRRNNVWKPGWWQRRKRPAIRLLTGPPNEERTEFFITPLLGYNQYDKAMAGVALTNRSLLPQRFEWLLAPVYSFGAQQLTGGAGFRYRHWIEDKWLREWQLGANVRRFHYSTFEAEDLPLLYQRISPYLRLYKYNHPNTERTQYLQWRGIWTEAERLEFSNDGDFQGTSRQATWLHELSYVQESKAVLNPYRFRMGIELFSYRDAFDRLQDHLQFNLEVKGLARYRPNKAIYWRAFGAAFARNTLSTGSFLPPSALSIFDRGVDDYRYDNFYFGRSATSGWASQQLAERQGGFKVPISGSFPLGQSNGWMVAVNSSVDLPFTPNWLPLKPYLDLGLYERVSLDGFTKAAFLWNGGLALEWLNGRVGIYLPLAGTNSLMDRLAENGNFLRRISFRLQFNSGDTAPWDWLDGFF